MVNHKVAVWGGRGATQDLAHKAGLWYETSPPGKGRWWSQLLESNARGTSSQVDQPDMGSERALAHAGPAHCLGWWFSPLTASRSECSFFSPCHHPSLSACAISEPSFISNFEQDNPKDRGSSLHKQPEPPSWASLCVSLYSCPRGCQAFRTHSPFHTDHLKNSMK